jgi:hypothetical protein
LRHPHGGLARAGRYRRKPDNFARTQKILSICIDNRQSAHYRQQHVWAWQVCETGIHNRPAVASAGRLSGRKAVWRF